MTLQTEFGDGKTVQGQIGATGKKRIDRKELGKKFDKFKDEMTPLESLAYNGGRVAKGVGVLLDATGIGIPEGIAVDMLMAGTQGMVASRVKKRIAEKEGYTKDDAPGVVKETLKHSLPLVN